MNKLGNSIIAKLTCEKLALQAISLSNARAADLMRRISMNEISNLREQVAELIYKLKAYAEF